MAPLRVSYALESHVFVADAVVDPNDALKQLKYMGEPLEEAEGPGAGAGAAMAEDDATAIKGVSPEVLSAARTVYAALLWKWGLVEVSRMFACLARCLIPLVLSGNAHVLELPQIQSQSREGH